MDERINETEMEEVSGGNVTSRGLRRNNRCPKCGATIKKSDWLNVSGIGNKQILHCDKCNISWIAEQSCTEIPGYHMVSTNLIDGSLADLGPYNG